MQTKSTISHNSGVQQRGAGANGLLLIEDFDQSIDGHFIKESLAPYLKNLYRDLTLRSLSPNAIQEGKIDKTVFLTYCNLPGIINERLLRFFEANEEGLVSEQAFVKNLVKIFASDLETRMRLTFQLYDFDSDGLISREDIRIILSYLPFKLHDSVQAALNHKSKIITLHQTQAIPEDDDDQQENGDQVPQSVKHLSFSENQSRISSTSYGKQASISRRTQKMEGLYMEEEGRNMDYKDRQAQQKEIAKFLLNIFESKKGLHFNFEEYSHFNKKVSSEMFYAIMSLLHDRLSCSPNVFRLKKMFRKKMSSMGLSVGSGGSAISAIASPTIMSSINLTLPKYVSLIHKSQKHQSSVSANQSSYFTPDTAIKKRILEYEKKRRSTAISQTPTTCGESIQSQQQPSQIFVKDEESKYQTTSLPPTGMKKTVDYIQTYNVGMDTSQGIHDQNYKQARYPEIQKVSRDGSIVNNSALSSVQSPLSQTQQMFFMHQRIQKQNQDVVATPNYISGKFNSNSKMGVKAQISEDQSSTSSNSLSLPAVGKSQNISMVANKLLGKQMDSQSSGHKRGQSNYLQSFGGSLAASPMAQKHSDSTKITPKSSIKDQEELLSNATVSAVSAFDSVGDCEELSAIDNFSPHSQLARMAAYFESECYLKTKNDRYKKHWVVLMGNEIYCYKHQNDNDHLVMHSLVSTFVKELPMEKSVGDSAMELWPLKIFIPPAKSRVLYFSTQIQQHQWIKQIQESVGFTEVTSYYTMGSNLGKGQFGQVKLSQHLPTGMKTAIKIVRKRDMKPIEVYQQRKEIDVLKMCQHPNIVGLVDLFENIDHYYIVLEYMDGKDLFDYLKFRSFQISEDRAREIILQIAQAVQYLHSYGIVHRDIKLENVMMSDNTDRGMPKLADFGLAKFLGPTERSTEPFGTLGYVAPEVLRKEPYSFSCDLWSLGCITYALLSGSLPFDHQSQSETIKMTIHSPLIFDLPCWKEVSPVAKDFISQLLIKDPTQRMTIEKALQHPWIKNVIVKK